MKALYDQVSIESSKLTTRKYSTSFSYGIRFLHRDLRAPIYSIYGFVRFADEIVDTLHDFPQEELLREFKQQTFQAIKQGISLNPILNSFQMVVNRFDIPKEYIEQFFSSMEMDLKMKQHNSESYFNYVLGSAEVVGLMCLKLFTHQNPAEFEELKSPAMKLGSAFQKINFLRDMNADFKNLGRVYFPEIELDSFTIEAKRKIESEIENDFAEGYLGIKQLPKNARLGVYVAYVYYLALFKKIKKLDELTVLSNRIRISNAKKMRLLMGSIVKNKLNWI